jgi:glutamyl-tRNA synthetase
LAPSPTGSLHLGNVFSFVINWVIAKQNDWDVILRIEDIDGPRKKNETIEELIQVLQWLGLDWSGKPIIQTEHQEASNKMLQELKKKHLVYHCSLSRQEIAASLSAPHDEIVIAEPAYRPTDIQLHNEKVPEDSTNWRFMASNKTVTVSDECCGTHQFTSSQDFIIWTKSNVPAYQLAVVADDHRDQITHVVRGCDLLESTSWQEQLYSAMEWPIPKWFHHPLIVGEDGKRLAKRHGDTRISMYRDSGISSERIVGLIATWSNTQSERTPMSLNEFRQSFDISQLQRKNITCTKEDESWLLERSC